MSSSILQLVEIGKSFEGYERTANRPSVSAPYFQQPRAFVMDVKEGSRSSDDVAFRAEVGRQHQDLIQVFNAASRGYGWLAGYWRELLRDAGPGADLVQFVSRKLNQNSSFDLQEIGFTPLMIADVILTFQQCLIAGRANMDHNIRMFMRPSWDAARLEGYIPKASLEGIPHGQGTSPRCDPDAFHHEAIL